MGKRGLDRKSRPRLASAVRLVFGARARRAGTGVVDQIVYSLTNFLLTVLIARRSAPHVFGEYSVLLATYLVASAVNRGIAAEPLIVKFSTADRTAWAAASRRGLGIAVAFGSVSGAALIAVVFLARGTSFIAFAVAFGVGMPFLFAQDFLRYASLAAGRPKRALVNDVTVLVLQIIGLSLLLMSNFGSASIFVWVWVIAGIGGGGVGLAVLRIPIRYGSDAKLATQRDLAIRFGLDNFITQLSQQGAGYLVALVAGLAAAGGFRAAQTVFTPPAVLMLGVQIAAVPELVRLRAVSLRKMRAAVLLIAITLFLISSLYYLGALAIPRSGGQRAFGASWNIAADLLPLIGISMIAGGLINAAVAGLRALADGRRTLQARYIGVVIAVCTLIPTSIIEGAHGAALGLALGTPIQAAVWWWRLAASTKEAVNLRPAEG